MRIISGKYKGKKLKGFNIEGTRPTMDRVKESLFAMIQNYINTFNNKLSEELIYLYFPQKKLMNTLFCNISFYHLETKFALKFFVN